VSPVLLGRVCQNVIFYGHDLNARFYFNYQSVFWILEMNKQEIVNGSYTRYQIETKSCPDLVSWPNRFLVKVNKPQLAWLLLQEIIHQRGDIKAITSRPCLYGTFSGPIGGFAPRPQHCVGCLRCTIQHPKVVQIHHNPDRRKLGDSFFTSQHIDTVAYEAETGNVPVKGAGYRGPFSGEGWDSLWTDMSEIVRPTRDGIHGREFISTVTVIAEKPSYLNFDQQGNPTGVLPRTISIPIPTLFDQPPASIRSKLLFQILSETAQETHTYAILPIRELIEYNLNNPNIIPLVKSNDSHLLHNLAYTPPIIEWEAWDDETITQIINNFPTSISCLRIKSTQISRLMEYFNQDIRVFHITTNYHGRGQDNRFILDLIHQAHKIFVDAGIRDEVTLIGSGGVIAAEHVPKALISGLDVVALDMPLLVALQARFLGECIHIDECPIKLPNGLSLEWGIQRIKNLLASWRNQLLEIMGAMGIREARRLRGEIGRAMFHNDLEREAFSGINGYEN
jgi:hypothetical protein